MNPLPHPDAQLVGMPRDLASLPPERGLQSAETPEPDAAADLLDPDAEVQCWCGAKGKASELFDDSCLQDGCGGSGVLNCYCGGDLCACHNHGEVECPGCEDCEGGDDYDDESEPEEE